MRVFQKAYTNAKGKRAKLRRYTIEFTDHDARLRRLVGFTDKAASLEAGRKIERIVGAKLARMQPDADLAAWLEGAPDAMRTKLAEWAIIDAARVAATKPIYKPVDDGESRADHLADFEADLHAKGNTAQHVRLTVNRIRAVVEGCGCTMLSELTASKVSAFLASKRGPDGWSIETSNHHLRAIKSFCNWLVRSGRLTASPLAHLKAQNANTDRRKVRRSLTPDEARRLILAASAAPERYGMAGNERSVLYRLAIETGLRAGELRTLTRHDFDLAGDTPSVRILAANSKNRKAARIPLRAETATMLRDFMGTKHPVAPVFSMPAKWNVVRMLRADLADARNAWIAEAQHDPDELETRGKSSFLRDRDDEGRTIDFHALRHTTASWLAAEGVHPSTAQRILRHHSPHLTLSAYTHVGDDLTAKAIASLPTLDTERPGDAMRATGTLDDAPHGAQYGAQNTGNDASDGHESRHEIGYNDRANRSRSGGIGRRDGFKIRCP